MLTFAATGITILAAGSFCAVIVGVILLVLLDLVRGRTRWQVRRRLLFAARVRFVERVGRTPEALNRDRAAVLGCSARHLERLSPEELAAQLRLAMLNRGASALQAYYLRSPATEDFLLGRAQLPPPEDLARAALLEHLVTDGIALPHDSEYLAAKAGMRLTDWLALPHPTRQQVASRLFDLTTELPRTTEDVDRQWQAVFLRRSLTLQEWRSIPLVERDQQAENYLTRHPELVLLEIDRRTQELDLNPPVSA